MPQRRPQASRHPQESAFEPAFQPAFQPAFPAPEPPQAHSILFPDGNPPTLSPSPGLSNPTQRPQTYRFDTANDPATIAPSSHAHHPITMSRGSQPSKSPERNSPVAAPAAASQTRPRESISTACLACRNKHLKCDGSHPCSRCVGSGSDCAYVASRRGYKGPRRGTAQNPNKRQAVSPPEQDPGDAYTSTLTQPAASICPFKGSSTVSTSPCSSTVQTPLSYQSQTRRPYCETSATDVSTQDLNSPTRSTAVQGPLPSLAERCLDSFYQNFHASHPFVLPKDFLLRFAREGTIEPLLSAMRWVGSVYIDVPSSRESLFDEAYQRVRDASKTPSTRDAFLVQAMMILIVGMDGATMNEKARGLLRDVEKLAIEIALNTRPFAIFHGRGMPVLEESWRRTWWDLFVIDGMIAGVHRQTNFDLFDIASDVALPCEEAQFLSGSIPPPRYLEELEDQEFTLEDGEFSSFAYRILCARNLGKLMRTPPIDSPEDENLARIEALLTNWRLHLPASKRDVLDREGRVDEMMFQAHMMLHATSILLHQPHSQLDTSPANAITSCAPHQAVLVTGQPFNAHTRHAISSANAISHLVTLPSATLTSHTHFFTCVLTLSSIVHLSKWALNFVQYDDDDLRQLLRLNVGALSELACIWPAAECARGQVRKVAGEIYHAKKQVQAAPQFWFGLTRDRVMSTIAADDAIIEEIERPQIEQRVS